MSSDWPKFIAVSTMTAAGWVEMDLSCAEIYPFYLNFCLRKFANDFVASQSRWAGPAGSAALWPNFRIGHNSLRIM